MDLSLLGLIALALVDSTSFGTLLIPIWFLLAPGRLRPGRFLTFLGTVAGVYLLVGVALVSGAGVLLERAAELGESEPVAVGQAVLGAALLVGSFTMTGKKDAEGRRTPGRILRWRDRATGAAGATGTAGEVGAGGAVGATGGVGAAGRVKVDAGSGIGPLLGLAVGAVVLELATMLPYLAATGIIAAADLTAGQRLVVLAGYCLVMVLPALVLLALRLAAHRAVEPFLRRIGDWLERTGAETTAWVVGIIGFLLLRDAVMRLPSMVAWLDTLGVSIG